MHIIHTVHTKTGFVFYSLTEFDPWVYLRLFEMYGLKTRIFGISARLRVDYYQIRYTCGSPQYTMHHDETENVLWVKISDD